MRTRAVLLDALGTLVELRLPAARLRALLAERGFRVSEECAAAGFAAEIRYYLAHQLDGADRDSLDDLRDRCAGALMEALRLPGLDRATARWAMMGALRFEPFPEVAPALRALRRAGVTLVVASNWDCSLPDWLGPAGLLELVDAVVTSAEVGATKPDAAVFRAALAAAGAGPEEALHVGDSLAKDVEGARAAGLRALLVQRSGSPPAGVEAIASLAELPRAVLGGRG